MKKRDESAGAQAMTDEELDRIEALANAATDGPWEQSLYEVFANDGKWCIFDAVFEDDAKFIAATREAVPALIAQVRRLRAKTVEVPVLGKVE